MARGDRSGVAQTEEFIVPGAKPLAKAIRNGGKGLRSSVRKRLKGVGEIVATEIRSRTPVGTRSWPGHRAGLLAKSTRSYPRSMSVRVANNAIARSPRYPVYRYGKRLEFDPAFGGRYAFFYPGYEAKREEAVLALRGVLDDVTREIANAPTGGT